MDKTGLPRRSLRSLLAMTLIAATLFCALFALDIIPNAPRENASAKKDSFGRELTGHLVNGSLTGYGKITYENGDTYEGGFANGAFSGKGKFVAAAGWTYEGAFRGGKPNGVGVFTASGGGVYDGVFSDGAPSGKGTFAKEGESAPKYLGLWSGGAPAGEGVFYYEDGSSYRGSFKSGLADGEGSYIDAAGWSFEGTFAVGQLEYGILTFANGEILEINS